MYENIIFRKKNSTSKFQIIATFDRQWNSQFDRFGWHIEWTCPRDVSKWHCGHGEHLNCKTARCLVKLHGKVAVECGGHSRFRITADTVRPGLERLAVSWDCRIVKEALYMFEARHYRHAFVHSRPAGHCHASSVDIQGVAWKLKPGDISNVLVVRRIEVFIELSSEISRYKT